MVATDGCGKKRRDLRNDVKRGAASAQAFFNARSIEDDYDPFLDMDPVIQDSKAGMESLLSMCSVVEINSLCGALGIMEPCTRSEKARKVVFFSPMSMKTNRLGTTRGAPTLHVFEHITPPVIPGSSQGGTC